jgi:hypothetical protein
LVPGGVVVVISSGPAALAAGDPVVADLTPGRPLHQETWVHLLAGRGFEGARVTEDPSGTRPTLSPVPDDGAAAAAWNANLEHLNRVLSPPGAYAVIATRPH